MSRFMDPDEPTLSSYPPSPTLPSPPLPAQVPGDTSIRPLRLVSNKRSANGTHKSRDAIETSKLDAAFDTSSDPALFSQDETPDVENYTDSKRQKKQTISGPYWALPSGASASASCLPRVRKTRGCSQKTDRKFRRNFDSGIFMASDNSGSDLSSDAVTEDSSIDQTPEPAPKWSARAPGHAQTEHTTHDLPSTRCSAGASTTTTQQGRPPLERTLLKFKPSEAPGAVTTSITLTDASVMKNVEHCLEKGLVDIDLTDMSISTLPSDFKQLNGLVNHNPCESGQYSDLTLRPHIYLGKNNLSHFPIQLLAVGATSLLSLRQNKLTELPDEIDKLTCLTELNISGNQLKWLPFSILQMFDFGTLSQIHAAPNPWAKVPSLEEELYPAPPLIAHRRGSHEVWRTAASVATEIGAYGSSSRTSPRVKCRSADLSRRKIIAPSRATFLREMVLRNMAKYPFYDLDQLNAPELEGCSDNVKDMLRALCMTQQTGRHICTFCGRSMILPRYEWLEWWVTRRVTREPEPHADRDEQENLHFFVLVVDDGHDFQQDDTASESEFVMASSPRRPENELGPAVESSDGDSEYQDNMGLPFMRRSCGCKTQSEGYEEEEKLYPELMKEKGLSDMIFGDMAEDRWPTWDLWEKGRAARGGHADKLFPAGAGLDVCSAIDLVFPSFC